MIIVINQSNFDYFMKSSLNACSEIMYIIRTVGEKWRTHVRFKLFSVGKSVLHRCHPWKCGEFLYIFAQKFGAI